MQSNFPFRVARGLAVVVAILIAHLVIVWLFHNMRLPAPDFGPVIATIFVDEDPAAAPGSSQKAPPVGERERPASPASGAP
jgi:hypothetical protein